QGKVLRTTQRAALRSSRSDGARPRAVCAPTMIRAQPRDLAMADFTAPKSDPKSEEYEQKRAELRRSALEYHEFPVPGKIAVQPTKQLINQRDLALAYSPGVAAACEEIAADPVNAFRYTSRGNLVAVITNGTAVLGLGDIGPLAAKPVM